MNRKDGLGLNEKNQRDDFFFVSSEDREWRVGKPHGGPKYDKEAYEQRKREIDARDLDEKVRATASSLRQKEIRDPRNLYFVIQIEKEAATGKIHNVLERLSATVHTYLSKDHTILLVSASEQEIHRYEEEGLPLAMKEPLIDFRELRPSEQISKELEAKDWDRMPRPVILHLIPNIGTSEATSYLDRLSKYFESIKCKVLLVSHPDDGMLLAQMDRKIAEDLLKRANYVFKIHDLPLGILSKVRSRKRTSRRFHIAGKASSVDPAGPLVPLDELPPICVVDSGVNEIPPLSGLIVERRKHPSFSDADDGVGGDGHGTPIACLVARGEGNGSPRARIISYKMYSDGNRNDAFSGMMDAIRNYSSTSKVFISSIVFEIDALPAYARLDGLIQRANICFVSSVGNIEPDDVRKNSNSYPSYIRSFPVLHPAQNIHVIGVGSITRKEKVGSVAPKDAISPFTRCGKTLTRLHDVNKPDVAEHGGNVCHGSLNSNGIGVSSFCRDGRYSDSLVGTSFSAPLVAGRLAEIVTKYGSQLRNAETLQAILYMSCIGRDSLCVGSGVPRPFLTVDGNHAVFVSEGTIPLSDLTSTGYRTMYSDRIIVQVPRGVGRIGMCLVHSDNYDGMMEPSLDTYLQVKAWKSGREGSPVSSVQESVQHSRVNTKFFSWQFEKKSMEALWTFEIIPESTVELAPSVRRRVEVRYGCVIMLTSRTSRLSPLSEDVRQAMRRWGSIHDA
jgi:hypothetical protein